MDKALVVDDNAINRRILASILQKEGFELLEAIDGEEAVETSLREKPDIVLLDIMMPKMDGYAVCETLKAHDETRDIPIIFLSALSEVSDKIKGLELGAVDYITKPFDRGEVLARVRSQLEIRHLTKSLIEANRELLARQRRLDEDLVAAAQIQKSLIPAAPPEIDNFVFAWEFIPCERIGGDILNIHRLDESHLAIYVLDVSGHGVPSAMVTVSVSQSLSPRTGSILKKNINPPPFYRIVPPADVLAYLDKEYPIERFNKYFTIAYLILNTKTGRILYSTAAHPMPILVRRRGEIEFLDKGGTMIGTGWPIPFEEGEVTLEEGDRLFVYTDGIVEYANAAGEQYGEDTFREGLRKPVDEPIDITCARVIESLNDPRRWCQTARRYYPTWH